MPNAKGQRGKEAKGLAVRMARDGGISVSRARELEGQLTEILMEGLLADGEVRINGFGVLEVVERSPEAWDPKRRRMVERRVRRVVRFRGAGEKQMLNAEAQRGGDAEGAKGDTK